LILNDKTYSILDEFFSFIKSRLSISEIHVKKKEDSQKIEECFDSSKHSAYAIRLFETYISQNRTQLLSVKDQNERHIYLENTFRDIQAIERIIKVNRRVKDTGLKYAVSYLSSAKKTGEIFKAISQLDPIFKDSRISARQEVHRNIYQYFLFDRLKNEFHNDPDNAITILKALRELLSKLDNIPVLLDKAPDGTDELEILKLVKRLFDEKSNVLDNHFYYSVYEKYKNTFSKLIEADGENLLNKNELLQIIREVDKNKETSKSRILGLEFALSQLNQTYEVVDTFWGADDYEPEYRYGKDIIRNPYQHLPVLLFIGENFDSSLKKKLYRFLNLNVEVSEGDSATLKEYVKDIIDELYKMNSRNTYSKSQKALIITYLNFVAQSKFKPKAKKSELTNYENLEERIIFDLEKQYEIIKYQFSKIDYEKIGKGNKLEYIQDHGELLVEIIYILLWLYRRNLNEDIGIQRAVELLHSDFDDPRIFQGIGLCYVSKVYRALKKEFLGQAIMEINVRADADLALQYLRSAHRKYQLLININSRTETSFLVVKNFISVLNSIADMNIRKYEYLMLKPDFSLIQSARECINEVKSFFNMIDLIYDHHPTYSATEIEIEYYEAQNFFVTEQYSSAHQKIVNASFRLNMLRKLPNQEIFVDEFFHRKNDKINQLAYQIFTHYSKKK